MPFYSFCCPKCDTRDRVERSEPPKRKKCPSCGAKMDRDYSRFMATKPSTWSEHYSDALAVHSSQVKEQQAWLYKETGLRYEFDSDGRPKLESRHHRNAHLKASGFFDKDAGYGDVAP